MIYFSHTSTQHPSDGEKITTNENKAPLWDLLSQSSDCQHLHGTRRNPNLSSLPMSNPPSDSGMSGSGTAERNLTSSSNTSTSSTKASSSPWRLNKTTQSRSLISELPRKTKALLPTKSTWNWPTPTDTFTTGPSTNPSILQLVPNTLICQAHQLSDPDHLQQEFNHVTSALTTINQYPRSKFKTQNCTKQPVLPWHIYQQDYPITLVLPYLGKTSHHLQHILREANIKVRHTSSCKLHSMLHTHEDTQQVSRPGKQAETWTPDSKNPKPASDSANGRSRPSSSTPKNGTIT